VITFALSKGLREGQLMRVSVQSNALRVRPEGSVGGFPRTISTSYLETMSAKIGLDRLAEGGLTSARGAVYEGDSHSFLPHPSSGIPTCAIRTNELLAKNRTPSFRLKFATDPFPIEAVHPSDTVIITVEIVRHGVVEAILRKKNVLTVETLDLVDLVHDEPAHRTLQDVLLAKISKEEAWARVGGLRGSDAKTAIGRMVGTAVPSAKKPAKKKAPARKKAAPKRKAAVAKKTSGKKAKAKAKKKTPG